MKDEYERNADDAAQLSKEFGRRLRQLTETELQARAIDAERQSNRSQRHERLRARLGRRR